MKKSSHKKIQYGWQFRKLLKKGYRFKGDVLRARFHRNALGKIRLGFSVSAKTGNAVKRNLFKRRLRQYSIEKEVEKGFDAVVFPVVPLKEVRWKAIKKDMDKLVKHNEKILR